VQQVKISRFRLAFGSCSTTSCSGAGGVDACRIVDAADDTGSGGVDAKGGSVSAVPRLQVELQELQEVLLMAGWPGHRLTLSLLPSESVSFVGSGGVGIGYNGCECRCCRLRICGN
jgi:hypothetical protein